MYKENIVSFVNHCRESYLFGYGAFWNVQLTVNAQEELLRQALMGIEISYATTLLNRRFTNTSDKYMFMYHPVN